MPNCVKTVVDFAIDIQFSNCYQKPGMTESDATITTSPRFNKKSQNSKHTSLSFSKLLTIVAFTKFQLVIFDTSKLVNI